MSFDDIFARVLDAVDTEAYFTPVDAVQPAQRLAMAAIQDAIGDPSVSPAACRALIDKLHERGRIDAVMRLSALHVLACHPRVADYAEAARLAGEQELAALQLGGPALEANLASADRHRGVVAFLNGHLEAALEYFARAFERERSAENIGNVLCALCALGELDDAVHLLVRVRATSPEALVAALDRSILADPDLAPLRPEVLHGLD